ncbi:hypothetical protein IFM89_010031, partial [Coptis chinensis]
IIRYSFFGMKEAFGSAPSWLLWLRYSTFLLLYPSGITSEVGLIYSATPSIMKSDMYCIRMPNKWNFSFDYFYAAIIALGIYVPGIAPTFSLTSYPALLQAVHTCTSICLDRGKKLYPSLRKSETKPLVCCIVSCFLSDLYFLLFCPYYCPLRLTQSVVVTAFAIIIALLFLVCLPLLW